MSHQSSVARALLAAGVEPAKFSVLQLRERNVADASHVPENSIVKSNIAARNVNSLFADGTDIKILFACNEYPLGVDMDEIEC
jgi:hypothetical protein